jgi:large subunit ribosomal protein L35
LNFAPAAASVAAVAFEAAFCHKPPFIEPPGSSGLPWRFVFAHSSNEKGYWVVRRRMACPKESKMPKLKTKSGAKKRFKITGTGKVVYAQAGKRHGMIKRTNKQIRNLRGTTTMFAGDAYNVKKFFLPNG